MLYSVKHITRHRYHSAVSQSLNELRLTPRCLQGQQLRAFELRIEPQPETSKQRTDYFGNCVNTAEIYARHTELLIEATSTVEVDMQYSQQSSLSWEEARELIALAPDEQTLEASEYIFPSPFVSCAPELEEFARPTFTRRRSLVEAMQELTARIYNEFQYLPLSTSIETPLLHVLRERKGVCQDFAHVMIGALRSVGLAARYVSGYLRSDPGNQGAEASHAWVSAFVPKYGWISFDPTNNVMPCGDHVVIAFGRDYGDVIPVRGIAVGGGYHSVEVQVAVQPIEQSSPNTLA